MASHRQPPQEQARTTSRAAQATNHTHKNQQDFSRRDVKRGTQRSETQTEGGQRRDDAGNLAPDPARPEQEHGDDKRPYKRAGR
jgi:hypothetical protein